MKAAYSRVSMTQPPTVTDQAILERLIPFPTAHFLAASDLNPYVTPQLLDLADAFVDFNRQSSKALDVLHGRTVVNLFFLVAVFYITALLFVLLVLGAVARYNGFSILKLISYLKEELLLVLGTSSSEAALPSLMEKMERAGASRSVVGLVVPTGYSFNLDGTNIYMTMAALFIAQAMDIDLSWGEQLLLLAVAMLSSKGAAGITGAGFITLAATLSVVPSVPVAGMTLILGVDRFMSECRALTNFIGNAVATIVVARWENELDTEKLNAALGGHPVKGDGRPIPTGHMSPGLKDAVLAED